MLWIQDFLNMYWEACCLFLILCLMFELLWDEMERIVRVAFASSPQNPQSPRVVHCEHKVGLDQIVAACTGQPKPKKKQKETPKPGEIMDVRDNTAKMWRQRKLVSIDEDRCPFLCEEKDGTTRRYRLGRVCKRKARL
jgi:hypothetical protein